MRTALVGCSVLDGKGESLNQVSPSWSRTS